LPPTPQQAARLPSVDPPPCEGSRLPLLHSQHRCHHAPLAHEADTRRPMLPSPRPKPRLISRNQTIKFG
jgi:hypothetical protein